jgi:hypothetical protein
MFNTPTRSTLFNSSFVFFSTILFFLHVSVCAHFFGFPFPLPLSIISWLHSPHSCFCEFQTSKINITFNDYSVCFRPWASHLSHSILTCLSFFN